MHTGRERVVNKSAANWMLAALRQDPALCVGDNTPYRVTDEGDYGIPVHAERRGLPHLMIELRQDLIAEPAGQDVWIKRLASLPRSTPPIAMSQPDFSRRLDARGGAHSSSASVC